MCACVIPVLIVCFALLVPCMRACFCVAMITFLFAALSNTPPFPAFLCRISLSLLSTDFSCTLIPKMQAAECWCMLMVAQAYTTGLAYRHSLDDPSGWRVKVRVAVTNTAVTSPPSTLLANWPSKTLSTKHGQLGEYRGQGQQNMPITLTGLAFALHAVTQDVAKRQIRAVFLQRQCNYDKRNRQWKNIMTSISSGF